MCVSLNPGRKVFFVFIFVVLFFACSESTPVNNESDDPIVEGIRSVDFNEYRGTIDSLPLGVFVDGEDGDGYAVGDDFNPFTGVQAFDAEDMQIALDGIGFAAFTSGDGNYSFGIQERGEPDLRDSRLFVRYTNTTDKTIVAFELSYDIEVWLLGKRDNRIRFKYNVSEGGFSNIDDMISTGNPQRDYLADLLDLEEEPQWPLVLDGSLDENRIAVSETITLTDWENEDGIIPDLEPGQTGYFRWQYSNGDFSSGNPRSALAINNIVIVPVFAESNH